MKKQKLPLLPVGLFLLAGLSVLGWMIINYGGVGKSGETIQISVEFSDGSGIIEGGVVRLAGANVGHVITTPTLNARMQVVVEVAIRNDLDLPQNCTFKIVPLSMLGDKAIYIIPPAAPVAARVQDGDHFVGVSPQSIDQLQSNAEELAQQANEVLSMSKETFQIINTTLGAYQTTATELNTSLARLNSSVLSEQSLAEMRVAISELRSTSGELATFSKELSPLAADTKGLIAEAETLVSGANARMGELSPALQTLPETLATFTKVGESLNAALTSEDSLVSTLTSDEEVTTDAKTFMSNLRTNGILGYKDNTDPDSNDPRDRYRGMRR